VDYDLDFAFCDFDFDLYVNFELDL
jgi:hypothetical protein